MSSPTKGKRRRKRHPNPMNGGYKLCLTILGLLHFFPFHFISPPSPPSFSSSPFSSMNFQEASFSTPDVDGPRSQTTSPIVTGSSVLAIKYKDGVMMMSDTLGNYGSLSMFKKIQRLHPVNSSTLIGGSGEISDFQYIQRTLKELTTADYVHNDNSQLTPSEIHSYLSRLLYQRRSKVNPLWNTIIVGGYNEESKGGESKESKESAKNIFLGITDLYGSCHTGDLFASGFGQHLSIPIMRKLHRVDMTYEEGKSLLEECMKVLIYRDCRTINSFQLGIITKDGTKITDPYSVETYWEHSRFVNPLAQ